MLSRFSPFSGNLVKEALQNPENEASVRSLFNSLDANKNGFLDEDELRKFTDGLVKVNTKLASLNLDVEVLNRRILRFADHNDTGHLSYSDFHALIQNNEYLEEALKNVADFKPVLNILQSNVNYASIKVSLLEKANSWTVSKTVQVNIDRTAPIRQFSVAIHSALLPHEVPQDYIYYMNNIDTPLNSSLALNDFHFSVDSDKSDTLNIISISAFKKVNLNTELSIFKLRKPPPNSYSFNESINFKNSKFQSKFSKGTFILNESIMYLFSPNTKNQEVLTKIFVLDYCKLFEEDDHSMCIRIQEDILGKEEVFIYPPKGCTLIFNLRSQSKNTIEKAVISVPLEKLLRRRLIDNVPPILYYSCKFLEPILQEEGLFRKSGNSESIDEYIQRLDYGETLDYSDCDDIHNVSSLIKKWLGYLPIPLLHPYKQYVQLLNQDNISNETLMQKLLEYLSELSPEVIIILHYLLKFLKVVSGFANTNLMTVDNLALVVAPNILRPTKNCDVDILTQQTNSGRVAKLVTVLITYCDQIDPLAEKAVNNFNQTMKKFAKKKDPDDGLGTNKQKSRERAQLLPVNTNSIFSFHLPNNQFKKIIIKEQAPQTILEEFSRICKTRDWDVNLYSVSELDGTPIDINSLLTNVASRVVVIKEINSSVSLSSEKISFRSTVTPSDINNIINSYEKKVNENIELRNDYNDLSFFVSNFMKIQKLQMEQFQYILKQRQRNDVIMREKHKKDNHDHDTSKEDHTSSSMNQDDTTLISNDLSISNMFDSFLQIQLIEYDKFSKLSEEITSRNSDHNNSDMTNNFDGVKEQLLRTKEVIERRDQDEKDLQDVKSLYEEQKKIALILKSQLVQSRQKTDTLEVAQKNVLLEMQNLNKNKQNKENGDNEENDNQNRITSEPTDVHKLSSAEMNERALNIQRLLLDQRRVSGGSNNSGNSNNSSNLSNSNLSNSNLSNSNISGTASLSRLRPQSQSQKEFQQLRPQSSTQAQIQQQQQQSNSNQSSSSVEESSPSPRAARTSYRKPHEISTNNIQQQEKDKLKQQQELDKLQREKEQQFIQQLPDDLSVVSPRSRLSRKSSKLNVNARGIIGRAAEVFHDPSTNPQTNTSGETDDEDSSLKTTRLARPPSNNTLAQIPANLFQISFSDGEKKVIKYDPSANLEAILQKICSQRSLIYNECSFQDYSTDEKILPANTNMSQIPSRHLYMIVSGHNPTATNPKVLRTSTLTVTVEKDKSLVGGVSNMSKNYIMFLFPDEKRTVVIKSEDLSIPIKEFSDRIASKYQVDIKPGWTLRGTDKLPLHGSVEDYLGQSIALEEIDGDSNNDDVSINYSGGVYSLDKGDKVSKKISSGSLTVNTNSLNSPKPLPPPTLSKKEIEKLKEKEKEKEKELKEKEKEAREKEKKKDKEKEKEKSKK